ncbi:MAG: radical SAM protein [Candidatus Syntrophopropionicum ammoniitolerans]
MPRPPARTCCVLLEVTRRCNLRCSFCFAEGGSGEDIPLATVRENLYELAVPGKTLVQLSGGNLLCGTIYRKLLLPPKKPVAVMYS